MRRARTRRERRAREQRTTVRRRVGAVLALIAVALVVMALPAALIWRQMSETRLSVDADGCAAEHRPRHVLLIIDQSDELSPQWTGYVQQLIPAIAAGETFPAYARLSVFTLSADLDAPLDLVLSQCRPPDPEQGSLLFDTRSERAERQAAFDAFYQDEIAAAVGRTGQSGPRRATPLLEAFVALQDVLLQQPAEETTLIIVSDMMQYSANFSHYGGYPDLAAFASSRAGDALLPFLRVDAVDVNYVRRPELSREQNEAHDQFWRDYFARAGVERLSVVSDPLAALETLPR